MEGHVRVSREFPWPEDVGGLLVGTLLLWLTVEASWRDREIVIGGQRLALRRGQAVFGRVRWAKRLDVPPSTLEDALAKLAGLGLVERSGDKLCSVVTVLNYDSYVDQDSQKQQQSDIHPTSIRHPSDTSEEVKKGKKGKKITASPSKATWLTPYWEAWERVVGSPHAGKLARYMKPVHDALGAGQALTTLHNYLDTVDSDRANLAWFSEHWKSFRPEQPLPAPLPLPPSRHAGEGIRFIGLGSAS